VIGVWYDFLDVLAGEDAVDVVVSRCGAHVDIADAPVGNRATENLSVQHARQAQIVHVFGAASDLGVCLYARQRAPDLLAVGGGRRHQCAAPWLEASAWRIARST